MSRGHHPRGGIVGGALGRATNGVREKEVWPASFEVTVSRIIRLAFQHSLFSTHSLPQYPQTLSHDPKILPVFGALNLIWLLAALSQHRCKQQAVGCQIYRLFLGGG